MKRLMILLAVTMSIAACTQQPDKTVGLSDTLAPINTGAKESEEPTAQPVCFQKLGGNANQDTTSLKLVFEGNKVTGDFRHYPKEKDRRIGKINATRDGELIKGTWIYMQEGMTDTLQVEFKLDGDKLVQKNYTIDPKTGREVFSEASVFNTEFDRVDCKN